MKERIKASKYLFIGGVMGISQQFLGMLDYELYKGRDIFSFRAIMGGFSIYAAIILYVIFRNRKPKQQYKDLFLYFLGLDFFYYLYIFIKDLIQYINYHSPGRELSYYFQNTHDEIFDFIKWTVIGTLAGVWAMAATKFRDKNQNKVYYVFLIPLYLVIIMELAGWLNNLVHFIIQKHNGITWENNTTGVYYLCPASQLLTSLTTLVISILMLIKHRSKTKSQLD